MSSFQSQNRANQGSIFLHLHLWMHTILASRYLTDHSSGRREVRKPATNGNGSGSGNGTNGTATGLASGQATPHTMTVNNMWRNSARTIGDILVLTDIINPFTYVALPFVNQAFYVAGSCYVKGKSASSVSRLRPTLWDTSEPLLTRMQRSSNTIYLVPTPNHPNVMPNKPNYPEPY